MDLVLQTEQSLTGKTMYIYIYIYKSNENTTVQLTVVYSCFGFSLNTVILATARKTRRSPQVKSGHGM